MSTPYSLTLHLSVHDAAALHAHALEAATSGDGAMSAEQAVEFLGTSEEPDVGGCLRMIFDPGISPPGVSILGSTCE